MFYDSAAAVWYCLTFLKSLCVTTPLARRWGRDKERISEFISKLDCLVLNDSASSISSRHWHGCINVFILHVGEDGHKCTKSSPSCRRQMLPLLLYQHTEWALLVTHCCTWLSICGDRLEAPYDSARRTRLLPRFWRRLSPKGLERTQRAGIKTTQRKRTIPVGAGHTPLRVR